MKILIYNLTFLFLIIVIQSCNTGFKIDSNEVSFVTWNEGLGKTTHSILMADSESFKIIDQHSFGIDKNQAYFKWFPIVGSDPATFVVLNKIYSKDRSSVYRESDEIQNANSATFELVDQWIYGKDRSDYYFDKSPLKVNDIKSFQILSENYGNWAKDSFHYYLSDAKYPLADYASFEVVGDGYAKDKFNVYFQDSIVAEANPKYFKTSEYAFGEDNVSKFDGHIKLNIQDIDSYEIINTNFTKDKFHVYTNNQIVVNADPHTFEVVDWKWQKDKDNMFYKGELKENIDVVTFKTLTANYSKDSNQIYYYDKIVEGADLNSFAVDIMTHIGSDINRCYKNGKPIRCKN